MFCRFRPALTALVVSSALIAACDEPIVDDAEELEFRDTGDGKSPPIFNTPTIFTSEVAAVDTRGQELDGVVLVDVKLDQGGGLYTPIDENSLSAHRGTLKAKVAGVAVEGTAFAGSMWTFKVRGDTVTARLTTVQTSFDAGLWVPGLVSQIRKLHPDRLVYDFEWEQDDVWHKTCEEAAIGGALAVIYGNMVVHHESGVVSQRPNTLYFGCLSGSIGKASRWGYAPDNPSGGSVSWAAFMTATQMVRADYCADGTAHTDIGTEIWIRDRWGINSLAGAPNTFTTEAVWQVGGPVRCLQQIRNGADLLSDFQCADGSIIPRCSGDAMIENQWVNQDEGEFWTKVL